MWNEQALRARLESGVAGVVSGPGEPTYEQATAIWAKPRVLPRLVVRCAGVEDVRHAVRSARDAGAPLSVRGGGHDWAGRALCDGLTLDLTGMNGVGPVGSDGIVEAGGGAKGTDVYEVTDPVGRAPVLGSVARVGLGGLVTGGGYGPMMRRYGLACDNLRAATVVLADGQVVRAAEDGDPELFWAVRGGGGNFGVVTSIELETKPVPSVRSGVLVFPFERADDVLPRLKAVWANAPPELDVQFGIVPGPDGAHILYVSPTWCGDTDAADAALAPVYALPGRVMNDVRDQPFGASRKFFDKNIVDGLTTTADSVWVRRWGPEASAIVTAAMRARPNDRCFVLCHEFSGAAAEVPEAATAFGLRREHILFGVVAPTGPGGDGAAEAAWARELMARLAPVSFPGAARARQAELRRERRAPARRQAPVRPRRRVRLDDPAAGGRGGLNAPTLLRAGRLRPFRPGLRRSPPGGPGPLRGGR